MLADQCTQFHISLCAQMQYASIFTFLQKQTDTLSEVLQIFVYSYLQCTMNIFFMHMGENVLAYVCACSHMWECVHVRGGGEGCFQVPLDFIC